MTKIYLDLGVHNGDTIAEFYSCMYQGINPQGYVSVGVDPLIKYQEERQNIQRIYGTTFLNLAVSGETKSTLFRVMDNDVSSTIAKDKQVGKVAQELRIQTVTLSNLLLMLRVMYGKCEFVIRMDIEGAEYNALFELLAVGVTSDIKLIGVEWHGHKMANSSKYLNKQKEIEKRALEIGLSLVKIPE